jgi:hypothetical protein
MTVREWQFSNESSSKRKIIPASLKLFLHFSFHVLFILHLTNLVYIDGASKVLMYRLFSVFLFELILSTFIRIKHQSTADALLIRSRKFLGLDCLS